MDYIITVYKRLTNDYATPVAEIRWTGNPPTNGIKFAHKHGGDFIEIQSCDEYFEVVDQLNFV